MLMALTEQQAERRRVHWFFFVILDGGVAHQRRQEIDTRPPIGARAVRYLVQERATLRAGMIQVFTATEIVALRDLVYALCGPFRQFFRSEYTGKEQPWPEWRCVDIPGGAWAKGLVGGFQRAQRVPAAPERRAGCPIPAPGGDETWRRSFVSLCCSTIAGVFGCAMIGKPKDRLHARELPGAIASLEPRKKRWPIEAIPIEGERLRPDIRRTLDRVLMRKEGPPASMMRADEPECEIAIIGAQQAPVLPREPHRKRLVPPVVRKARLSARRGRQRAAGFGENVFLIVRVEAEWVAEVEPCLEARIALSLVVEEACELQIGDTAGRQACGRCETFRLPLDIPAVLLKRQGKTENRAACVVFGRIWATVFGSVAILDFERRHKHDAARPTVIESIEIEMRSNAPLSAGVIERK